MPWPKSARGNQQPAKAPKTTSKGTRRGIGGRSGTVSGGKASKRRPI